MIKRVGSSASSMQRTCTGSKECVGANVVMGDAMAQCHARHTVDEERVLRVEHEVVHILHEHGLSSV